MATTMYEYTRLILQKVSFDPVLFYKELKKAVNLLLPHEVEDLKQWLENFTRDRPELRECMVYLRK
jgi:phosphoserine phosphatase